MKSDSRISVRISTTELEDIDDFISRHPEFRNRSEYIRIAALKYKEIIDNENKIPIKKYNKNGESLSQDNVEDTIEDENYVNIKIPKDILYTQLSELVEVGIFSDIENAYQSLLHYITDKKIFNEFISERINMVTENIRNIDTLKEYLKSRGNIKNRTFVKRGEIDDE
ncbi:MAG: ribbon-helix-helix domain-containing protein [Thermoplasmata archaeon]